MTRENRQTPYGKDLEANAEIIWGKFIGRANELRDNLSEAFDKSPVERNDYSRKACNGGYNFGKTVDWVVEYSPHPKALENVAAALEAIVQWPNAGHVAWEMRRFIKFSSAHGYDNTSDIAQFGELLKQIGNNDPANKKKFDMDMDFFYWDSGWGVDGESSMEEVLGNHCGNVTGVIKGLARRLHPEIIDIEPEPTKEEIEAKEKDERDSYRKDFLADARSFYPQSSFFDILAREEELNKPYHKILAYPAEMADIADGGWINHKYEDPSDAMAHYYREMPYMVVKRADKNWFPPQLPRDYVDLFDAKFEKRLKKTQEQKPWLIDFSVKWQDALRRSFVGGNHEASHAGEVDLVYKNPRYDPKKDSFFNHEYELRAFEPEEEKLFLESVKAIQSITDQEPRIKPPENSNTLAFSGWREGYIFELADGRSFNVFLVHGYGSTNWEGKLVVVTHDGPEQLFKQADARLKGEI